jgi:hypothetical protein
MADALVNEQLEPLILTIRGHRVLLDGDLARLYGVRRNSDRFPLDFAFQLDWAEFESLRSQIVTGPERRGGTRVPLGSLLSMAH